MANPYYTCELESWVSGNTVYARMHFYRKDGATYHYKDPSFPAPEVVIDGTTYYDTGFSDWVHNGIDIGDVRTTTFSKTCGSNGTKNISWKGSCGGRCDFEGTWYASQYVNYYIEGLWANNLRRSQESFTMNVYLSNWGAGTNYRELQCWTYNASSLTTPRRWQPVYGGASSGDITVSNSSSGDLQIRGNTLYTLGVYADNGSTNTGSIRYGDATTLPYKDTLSLKKAHALSLDIDYSVPADGGRYDKTLQYSIDNGSSWITYDTISGGNAKTGTFTITGLAPITQYTIKSRVTTNNATYIVNNDDITVSTIGPDTPTLSVDSFGNDNIVWKYGTSTFGGGTDGLVRLYVDQTATPETEVDTYDQTGDHTFSFTALPNTEYKARSRAESTFSGELVYSEWSNVVSQITLPPAPTANSIGVLQYDTATTVTVRTNTTIPSDGGHYPKTLEYRYKLGTGNYGAWTTATTHSGTSALNYNIDIAGLPVDTLVTVEIRTSTTAGTTDTSTISITTTGTHQPPIGFDYTVSDNNIALQTWLSGFDGYTSPIFILGKSRAKVSIADNEKGITTDGATLVDYDFSIPNDNVTINIPWVSGSTLTGMFEDGIPEKQPTYFPSNLITINGRVNDSLATYTNVSKSVLSLSWQEPTIEASAIRLNNKGNALLEFSGTYARLQDNSLNNGQDINDVIVQYRLEKFNGEVITDWTTITGYSTSIDENKPLLRNFSGSVTLENVSYTEACVIYTRITDHFTSATVETPMEIWDGNQVIYPADYEVEIWDWKTNTFIADLSYLIVDNLEIEWELNDVEEVNFSLDLLRFEEKCREMGVTPQDVLTPYKHDIRIRRNGEYILGCQLVEANIQLNNNPPARIDVKGTGFLNLFKDQYILDEAWSGYTYAQIARKLVEAAQRPDPLLKNPTGDIDTSYWLAANGIVASSTSAHNGDRCIAGSRSGSGWITIGSQLSCEPGKMVSLDVWVKGQSGVNLFIREREYITQPTGQQTWAYITANGGWQHIQVMANTTYENGYLIFETNRTDSSTMLYVDDCYVYAQDDDNTLCDFGVTLGVDEASEYQESTRQVSYSLQNIKDALIDLTNNEDDNFDFEFTYDRKFNCYLTRGEEKLEQEVLYPGNVESMTIGRSASNLANKVYHIGSGIGDERLQVGVSDTTSRQTYGTHESIVTNSNVSLQSTLTSQAVGMLWDRKDPTNLPKAVIKDGSINPSNTKIGDSLPVQVQMDEYLGTINDIYRVVNIRLSVDEEAVEQMTLTLEPPLKRPERKMVRYIRNSLNGNTVNAGNHWVEIEALMLVGNDYINVARGKTVYGNFTPESGTTLARITDGDTATANYCGAEAGVRAVTIDLGTEYPIDYIRVWHYYGDNRRYKENVLSVGTSVDSLTGTAPLSTVVWKYSADTTNLLPDMPYQELSAGHKSRWIQEDNVDTERRPIKVRYIRESHLNNSLTYSNLWSKITVLQKQPDGTYVNLTLNTPNITCSGTTMADHGVDKIVDGEIISYCKVENTEITRNSVTIDLGEEKDIDYIRVWHWVGDDSWNLSRTIYGSHLSVGTTLPDNDKDDLETILWADKDNEGVAETITGRSSKWIQGVK